MDWSNNSVYLAWGKTCCIHRRCDPPFLGSWCRNKYKAFLISQSWLPPKIGASISFEALTTLLQWYETDRVIRSDNGKQTCPGEGVAFWIKDTDPHPWKDKPKPTPPPSSKPQSQSMNTILGWDSVSQDMNIDSAIVPADNLSFKPTLASRARRWIALFGMKRSSYRISVIWTKSPGSSYRQRDEGDQNKNFQQSSGDRHLCTRPSTAPTAPLIITSHFLSCSFISSLNFYRSRPLQFLSCIASFCSTYNSKWMPVVRTDRVPRKTIFLIWSQ